MFGFLEGLAKFKVIQDLYSLLMCFQLFLQMDTKMFQNQYISIEVKMAHDLLNKQQVLLCLYLSYVFQSKLCSSRNYSEILFDDDDVDFKRCIIT